MLRYKHFSEGIPLQHFCGQCKIFKDWYILILAITSLWLNHHPDPPRHTLNQVLTHLWVNCIPLLLNSLPQFQNTRWWCFILCKPSLQMRPQVFNWIEVWRLCWPLKTLHFMVLEPLLGLFACVFGVIVLLEDDVAGILAIIFKGTLKVNI